MPKFLKRFHPWHPQHCRIWFEPAMFRMLKNIYILTWYPYIKQTLQNTYKIWRQKKMASKYFPTTLPAIYSNVNCKKLVSWHRVPALWWVLTKLLEVFFLDWNWYLTRIHIFLSISFQIELSAQNLSEQK